MAPRHTQTRVPTGPALVRTGDVGLLSASVGALSCGGQTEAGGVPPTTGTPTATPGEDAGRDGGVDGARDAARDVAAADVATTTLIADSGYAVGLYDATGRDAAHAIGDAASDGYIFEPPCGKRAPPHRPPR